MSFLQNRFNTANTSTNILLALAVVSAFALLAVLSFGVSTALAKTTTKLSAIDDPIDGRFCASTDGTAATVDVMDNDINAAIIGSSTTPGKVTSVRVDGDYAYVGGYKFAIYDISSPQSPTQISNLEYDSSQQIRDIHLSDDRNYAFVADSSAPSGDDKGSSVYVIDISDKSNPTVADRISTDYGYHWMSWGAESIDKTDLTGDYLYLADNNPGDVWSINISDPTSINFATTTALSSVPTSATCRQTGLEGDEDDCEGKYPEDPTTQQTKELKVSGDYAYTVHYKEEAVKVTDISDPQNIEQVGGTGVQMTAPETLDFVGDNYAYVGGEDGAITILDISDPTNPAIVNQIQLQGEDVTSLYAEQNKLYATLSKVDAGDDPDLNVSGGIAGLDVSDPANPETLWAKKIGNSPERIYPYEEYLYVVDSASDSLYVVDPDGGDIRIDSFTQPDNGTVSLDDNGTPDDETDDKLTYYPSATGTDSFTYTITPEPKTGSTTQDTATTSFDVQEDQCVTGDVSISADPQDVPEKEGFSTTSISWSFEDVTRCETQDGNNEWRNIDPDKDADCLDLADSDGETCSGSDSAEISGLDSDTTFTLACDTAADGDDTLDISTSTTVTVTDLTACPFVEGGGDDEYDQVVKINEGIRADYGEDAAQTSQVPFDMNAGNYEIGMFIYDDARGEDHSRSAQNQEYERAFARFSEDTGGSERLEAEDQETNTAVYQDGSCGGSYSEQMQCNGYIDFGTHSIDENDNGNPETISVRARGDSGEERLALLLDDSSVAEWNLTTDFQVYNYEPSSTGNRNIKVEFVNDDGTNRDAVTDYVEIGSGESGSDPYEVLTESTDDIPDDSQLGTTTKFTTITLDEPTEEVQYRHHAYFRMDGSYFANSFRAACIGIDGDTSDPSTDISASPESVEYSGSTTLDWTFTDVSSGTTTSDTGNSQWANTEALPSNLDCNPGCTGSSSATIDNLTQDTTFTVTFDGSFGGTTSDSVWVDVDDKPVRLTADPNTVDPNGTTTLSWQATGMDSCEASSNPTNSAWTSSTNVETGSGTKTITDMSTTTDFKLTCEDTSEGSVFTDSTTVEVQKFELATSPRDIWGVQLPGSITTQSKVTIDPTPNFDGNVKLSATSLAGDIGADYQWVDSNGNVKQNPILNKFDYSDGYWLQAQLGSNVESGETTVQITAEEVNGSSTATETIEMHVRSIGEQ